MKKLSIVLAAILLLTMTACSGNTETPSEPAAETYQFTYKQTAIAINAPAEPIVKALGEPKSYTEETSCAFEGLDKTYFYGGFYLTTYPKDGKDFVSRIWFVDDSVSTDENIFIGSTKADAVNAYGDIFAGSNSGSVTLGQSKLTVILDNDTVSSIQYELLFD